MAGAIHQLPPQKGDPLEQLLLDVEARLGIVITIHDRAAIFRDPAGESLLALHRRRHRHSYCQLDRYRRPGWDQHCLDHCWGRVNAEALRQRAPFTHVCWKGLQEVVVPVFRDGIHMFTLFAGGFRPAERQSAPRPPAFPPEVCHAHEKLPASDPENLKSIARVLQCVGAGLLAQVDQALRCGAADGDRKAAVRRFLHYHAHEAVRLRDLARAISLSSSRASHLVRELFGMSFQEMLLQERIARARVLLMSSNYPVSEVGRRVGIDNEYYFNRLFKKKVGIPPGRFRRENQQPIGEVSG